jgi:hypothetical protein
MGAVYKGLCPFHPDQKTPSLVVDPEKQTWKCFGCQAWGDAIEWVQKTDGLEFPEAAERLSKGPVAAPSHKPPAERTTTYDITDHKGGLIAQHVRRDHPDGTKTFAWVREGMPSLNGMKPADLPLYGMPHLIAAAPGDPIIVCEGEKAAQSLLDRGILAMGTVCGAATTPDKKVLMPLLGAARVYLWPDNDPPGYGHMAGIARVLQDIGQVEIWLVRWPDAPKKGDAADFQGDINLLLESAERFPSVGGGDDSPITVTDDVAERRIPLMGGNTLRLIADNVRRERTGVHARVTLKLDDLLLGYDTFNLGRSEERLRLAKAATSQLPDGYQNVANADYVRARLDAFAMGVSDAALGTMRDVQMIGTQRMDRHEQYLVHPLLLARQVNIIYGPGGTSKTTLGLMLALQAGVNTLWLDYELSQDEVEDLLCRMKQGMNVSDAMVGYIRCERALADDINEIQRVVHDRGIELIVIDSMGVALGQDPNDAGQVLRFFHAVRNIRATVLIIDHTGKDRQKGMIGSSYKYNCGRNIWETISAGSGIGSVTVGIHHRKINSGALQSPIGYQFSYTADSVTPESVAPRSIPEILSEMSLTDQIEAELDDGPLSSKELSDRLGARLNNVAVTLSRKKNLFVQMGSGKWDLRTRDQGASW